MLALAEQYKKACNVEEQLLSEANAARNFDRTRKEQRAKSLEQMRSGKFEIIDVSDQQSPKSTPPGIFEHHSLCSHS